MKKALLLLLLLCGCVNVKRINQDINDSSVAIQNNRQAIDANTAAIKKNEQAIESSTQLIQLLSKHLPLLFFVVVVFIFGPFFLLMLFLQRLDKRVNKLLTDRHK